MKNLTLLTSVGLLLGLGSYAVSKLLFSAPKKPAKKIVEEEDFSSEDLSEDEKMEELYANRRA